jgi:hypothetical protein
VRERRLELLRGLVAELRAGELELLLARLDRVVGRDERGTGAAAELFEGDLRSTVRPDGGAGPTLPARADDDPEDECPDGGDHEDQQERRERSAARLGSARTASHGIGESVGGGFCPRRPSHPTAAPA